LLLVMPFPSLLINSITSLTSSTCLFLDTSMLDTKNLQILWSETKWPYSQYKLILWQVNILRLWRSLSKWAQSIHQNLVLLTAHSPALLGVFYLSEHQASG
jgi:hypothetical protein